MMCTISTVEEEIKVPGFHFRLNITGLINKVIGRSGLREGHVIIQTRHTTTGFLRVGLLVQEDESGLMDDLSRVLGRIAPDDGDYDHDNLKKRTENLGPNERMNAAAHIKSSFLEPSITLIFRDGQLDLGQWQSVLFFDFDPEGRLPRHLIIQVYGK